MLKKFFLIGALTLSGTGTSAFAAAPKAAQAKDTKLTAGAYSAKVGAIVCSGCGDFIQKTMLQQKGIESASVNQETKTVQFKVKKGTTVQLSALQKSLKAAADQMGMGADYQLRNVKKI